MTVAASYLKTHMARIHGICVPQTRGFDDVGGDPTTYVVSFPRVLQEVKCLVLGCPAVAHSAVRLHEHFMYRHFRSKVVVVQERAEIMPQCDFCGIHILEGRIIRHHRMSIFNKNTQMR